MGAQKLLEPQKLPPNQKRVQEVENGSQEPGSSSSLAGKPQIDVRGT